MEKSQNLKTNNGEKSKFENTEWRKVKSWFQSSSSCEREATATKSISRPAIEAIALPQTKVHKNITFEVIIVASCQFETRTFVVTCRPLGCIDFHFLGWSDNQFSSDGLITSLPLEKSDNQLADSPLEKIPTV